ncbi:peptidase domain-containing ABC transporter, partial [Marinilactibacillus psychrotolerans]
LEYETFSSIFSIKANSQENYMKNLLEKKNKDSMHAYYNRNKISNIYSTITYFINTFGPIIVLLLSLLFIPEGELNIGTFIFIFTLSSIYFQNFSSIFNTFNTLGTLKNNMIKINDITEQKDTDVYSGEERLETIKSIEFKNVFFSYPGQKNYTLKDLSFKISSNEKVGLAGPTGCGKSTILGLIIGIYKPTKGDIYINGINISDINIDEYKQKIGFVPQEPFVYNKSIKDNIIMNRDLEEEMINKSLESSNLVQELTNMPLGLETIISEGGTNISGGQKQRIIIARSIVHNPELLIFDEATSSLDNQTETIITENLKNMTQTQIIVAHRLSTIKDCNKIIFLINGEIEDSGSYYDLVSNNKKFEEFSK